NNLGELFLDPSPENLILYLTLDEGIGDKAYDYSGNKNEAHLFNNPTWIEGKFDKALRFDGINDYVKIQSQSLSGSIKTIEFWYRQDETREMGLIGQFNSTTDRWFIGTDPNNGYKLGVFSDGAFRIHADNVHTNKVWYHIVLVWDGNFLSMYVNGVKQSSISNHNPFVVDKSDTYIGVFWSNIPNEIKWYKGEID
ncbi:MAG: LamG domain-containing protein, partial [Candidatus Aenigmarchaeota archaeon]|nr:LamG domain-containing protein [Candidatus Aenigmarchaeota archaeon]